MALRLSRKDLPLRARIQRGRITQSADVRGGLEHRLVRRPRLTTAGDEFFGGELDLLGIEYTLELVLRPFDHLPLVGVRRRLS
ncbi:MAG: hypothetical protein IT432_04230 [Phycisphaerales bacterium]|nr:hypothetical protein [Phycisphaerales bacterium]